MAKLRKNPVTTKQTKLIHHPYQPPQDFKAPQDAVYKASTVFFPNVAAMHTRQWKDKSSYTYGLHGTPTTYLLEEKLAHIEGARQCLLVPSGLASIALIFSSLLRFGDEVLLPDNIYGPAKVLIQGEFVHWGITYKIYDPMSARDLKSKISPATRLIWLEAPGSVTLEFPPLATLIEIAKENKIITAIDNTWGAGQSFNVFDLPASDKKRVGVDISVQALTKYHSGGGDVLMGAVLTVDEALHQQIKMTHMRFGIGVGVNDVSEVLRSLPTLTWRYETQDNATRQLVLWALDQKEFVQILHPSLPTSPGHENWRTICESDAGMAACLFSVIFKEDITEQQVNAFCDALKLFKLGYSWAGPTSLVVPYRISEIRSTSPSYLKKGCIVRFAIGFESANDLINDIKQALNQIFRQPSNIQTTTTP